jgi:hypothetical protein
VAAADTVAAANDRTASAAAAAKSLWKPMIIRLQSDVASFYIATLFYLFLLLFQYKFKDRSLEGNSI